MNKSYKSKERPVRVGMISMGCAKNLVDAEIMLGSLLKSGVEITNDAAQADVVIVNTCSFIDSAQEESVDTILESAELREAKNRGQGLIVSGCLPQRFREELPKLLPEVDAFMGIDQVAQVGDIVKQAMEHRKERVQSPSPSARAATVDKKSKVQSKKSAVVGKLGELQKTLPNGEHDAAENIRGTANFGKTKTVVAPTAPAVMSVNARPVYIPDYETPRFRLTPRHFAYVKIAEGCNHP
jgi:ribosomal protein S12 methylthiotransferase